MDYHGQNGFLNILMCLKWWRDALDVESPDWEEAVNDVTWVLQEIQRYVVSLLTVVTDESETNSYPAAAAGGAGMAAGTNHEETHASLERGGEASNSIGDVHTPTTTNTARPKMRVQCNAAGSNRDLPAGGETTNKEPPRRWGTEGLSQEELDEMEDDPDADLEGE